MRFTFSDRFDAPLERVEEAVLSDEYNERLKDLPNVAERVVTQQRVRSDGSVRRVVHYKFGGHLPPTVESVLGASAVSWDEVAIFDPVAHEWAFEIEPHVLADRFECHGTYTFRAEEDATVREVSVELKVKIPVVGGRVEKAISDGLEETLQAEGRLLAEYLDGVHP